MMMCVLLAVNLPALMKSLELMWKGMLSIFIVIVIILLAVLLLGKITGRKKETE